MQSNEPSVSQLRAEAERNRETLAGTVQELRERVGDSASEIKSLISPANIIQEIRDYVRQERESAVDYLQRKVTENPLQLAAIAAAVAYPALGILRALPAPLWLIGGGLFLTSKRGRVATARATKDLTDAAQKGVEQFSDMTRSVRSDLQDRVSDARFGIEEAQAAVTERVTTTADRARAALHDVQDGISGLAEGASARAKDAAASLSHVAQDGRAILNAKAALPNASIGKLFTDNALLIAGFGAALGAVLAASIPRSEAENKLFGAGSEKLKQQARKLAEGGVQHASDIVTAAAGDVALAAAREGLNASGVKDAVSGVIDGVRNVADRRLDAALGLQKPDDTSSQTQTYATTERNV